MDYISQLCDRQFRSRQNESDHQQGYIKSIQKAAALDGTIRPTLAYMLGRIYIYFALFIMDYVSQGKQSKHIFGNDLEQIGK